MASVGVGKDVDSWCTKCKIVILHTVVAMVDANPKKVQCNSCGSNHVFRAHPPGEGPAKKAAPRKSRSSAAKAKPAPADYAKLMEGRDRSDARRYSPKAIFRKGEVIQHPKFGLGVATALKDATKVEVLFPEGTKVLVHAR